MALSTHGLVIIASGIIWERRYEHSTYYVFQVASDNTDGTTTRYEISLSVSNYRAEQIRDKIQVGTVCEIVLGTLVSKQTTSDTELPQSIKQSISINVKQEQFKFLKPCIYYEGIRKVTEAT